MARRQVIFAGAATAGIAVLALVLTLVLTGGSAARPRPAAPVAAPARLVAPPTTAAPPPTATPTPTPPPIPHDVVAPAAPTSFEMAGPAFDIRAQVCQMDNIRPLDPPGDQYHTVCWVREGFGVAPGSASGGTSYVLGHSWAEAQLVLNPLSTYVMPEVDLAHPVLQSGVPTYPVTGVNGYRIVLGTPNGTLTYLVTDAYTVAKSQAADVESLMAETTPDRIVLITCGVLNGRDVDQNVIVEAHLYSSSAATA